MITGYIAAALLLLTAAKFITKRLPFRKADAFFRSIHKVCGAALTGVLIIHVATVFGLLRQRPVGVLISGIALAVSVILAVASRALKPAKKRLAAHRAATALACVCLAAHIALGLGGFAAYQSAVAAIRYDDIAVSRIADGDYVGEYDVGYIYAKVDVSVENGTIKRIDILEHRNERGGPAESITDAIIAKQSLQVDAVSGATNSSRVIKKAVENALEQGIR
jgi:uncharacterized protein with FMN-binding domain